MVIQTRLGHIKFQLFRRLRFDPIGYLVKDVVRTKSVGVKLRRIYPNPLKIIRRRKKRRRMDNAIFDLTPDAYGSPATLIGERGDATKLVNTIRLTYRKMGILPSTTEFENIVTQGLMALENNRLNYKILSILIEMINRFIEMNDLHWIEGAIAKEALPRLRETFRAFMERSRTPDRPNKSKIVAMTVESFEAPELLDSVLQGMRIENIGTLVRDLGWVGIVLPQLSTFIKIFQDFVRGRGEEELSPSRDTAQLLTPRRGALLSQVEEELYPPLRDSLSRSTSLFDIAGEGERSTSPLANPILYGRLMGGEQLRGGKSNISIYSLRYTGQLFQILHTLAFHRLTNLSRLSVFGEGNDVERLRDFGREVGTTGWFVDSFNVFANYHRLVAKDKASPNRSEKIIPSRGSVERFFEFDRGLIVRRWRALTGRNINDYTRTLTYLVRFFKSKRKLLFTRIAHVSRDTTLKYQAALLSYIRVGKRIRRFLDRRILRNRARLSSRSMGSTPL